MPEERRLSIVEAYQRLGTYDKVQEELGCSPTTICKVIKAAGISKGIGGNQSAQIKVTNEQLMIECQTMTIKQIADKYGMHINSLPRRFKAIGVFPVNYQNCSSSERMKQLNERMALGEIKRKGACEKVFGESWHYIMSHDEYAKEHHMGFSYIESRNAKVDKIRLKCKSCGEIIERATSTFRERRLKCDNCERIKQEQRDLAEKRVELMRFFIAYKELKTPKRCCMCGEKFYSQYTDKKYCSDKCRRKKKKSGSSIRKRCRNYGVYYDPAVKSIDVFKRDHYICQICGIECITNDDKWGYAGPYSPSVDHIIPLAKGGTHTWENTQCAHIICNSYKRDLTTG